MSGGVRHPQTHQISLSPGEWFRSSQTPIWLPILLAGPAHNFLWRCPYYRISESPICPSLACISTKLPRRTYRIIVHFICPSTVNRTCGARSINTCSRAPADMLYWDQTWNCIIGLPTQSLLHYSLSVQYSPVIPTQQDFTESICISEHLFQYIPCHVHS